MCCSLERFLGIVPEQWRITRVSAFCGGFGEGLAPRGLILPLTHAHGTDKVDHFVLCCVPVVVGYDCGRLAGVAATSPCWDLKKNQQLGHCSSKLLHSLVGVVGGIGICKIVSESQRARRGLSVWASTEAPKPDLARAFLFGIGWCLLTSRPAETLPRLGSAGLSL